MALTEEEKRMARAYNIGYLVSTYEPRLMEKIIKGNPKNEFVKAMQVGRDHQEFYAGIPRKEHTREFKNGFHNGRTLAEHNPKMIDKLMTTKGLNKDYKRGLDAACKEFEVLSIQERIRKEPKAPEKDLRNDETFQKGFNVGYRLGADRPFLFDHLKGSNERYAKYLDGMKLGQEQHSHDLEKLREKEPDARLFPDDPRSADIEAALIENKAISMGELADRQSRIMNRKEYFPDVPTPKWLEKKPDKEVDAPKKDKNKDRDIDLDR